MELILAALLSISILILLNLRIKLRNSEERLSILSHKVFESAKQNLKVVYPRDWNAVVKSKNRQTL